MDSKIPTLGGLDPKTDLTQHNVPSTLRKVQSSICNVPLATIKTGIKRPSESIFQTYSQSKFKRKTPLTLMRTRSGSIINHLNTENAAVTRLDFFEPQILNKTPEFKPNKYLESLTKNESTSPKNTMNSSERTNDEMVKPVLTETRSTSPMVDWKALSADIDVSAFKSRILLLEKKIDDMNTKQCKEKIEAEIREAQLKVEIDTHQRTIQKLNELVSNSHENEKLWTKQLEELRQTNLEQTNVFEKQEQEYITTIAELKKELLQTVSKESTTHSAMASENLNLQNRINELENDVERANAEINLYVHQLSQMKRNNNDIDDLKIQLRNAKSEIQRLTEMNTSIDESSQLQNILKGEIAQYKVVKDENFHLKSQLDTLKDVRQQNVILNEKILNYEEEIKELKELVQQKNVDMAELEFNRKRVVDWMQIVGFDSPEVVNNQMAEMKKTITILTLENDVLKADLKRANLNDSLKNKSNISDNVISELKKKNDQLNDTLKRLNRKCLVLSKHCELYKKMVDSYENEATISLISSDDDQSSKTRITELENLIKEYKTVLEKQEEDLNNANKRLESISAKDKEIGELKLLVEQIREEGNKISIQKTNTNLSDITICQTDHNNYRVIHLRKNPITIRIEEFKDEYKQFKAENVRLKSLVEILESGMGNVADMTKQISDGIQHQQDLDELKKQLDSAHNKYNRLEDRYKKISKTYRQACYYLTGYRIDNPSSNIFKLTHMMDPEDCKLTFELNNNQISLIGNNAVSKYHDKFQKYLQEGDSYPAFLASITLELYNKNLTLGDSTMQW